MLLNTTRPQNPNTSLHHRLSDRGSAFVLRNNFGVARAHARDPNPLCQKGKAPACRPLISPAACCGKYIIGIMFLLCGRVTQTNPLPGDAAESVFHGIRIRCLGACGELAPVGRMTFKALPITSAGRDSPWGLLGIQASAALHDKAISPDFVPAEANNIAFAKLRSARSAMSLVGYKPAKCHGVERMTPHPSFGGSLENNDFMVVPPAALRPSIPQGSLGASPS
jgi:hypothetical protein